MHHLQKKKLLEYCRRHSLDYQEIDDTLTFSENKDHLKSLVPEQDPKDEMAYWVSQEEAYLKNHFLWHYIHCIREGKTKSSNVGNITNITEPQQPEFSLRQLALNTVCKA